MKGVNDRTLTLSRTRSRGCGLIPKVGAGVFTVWGYSGRRVAPRTHSAYDVRGRARSSELCTYVSVSGEFCPLFLVGGHAAFDSVELIGREVFCCERECDMIFSKHVKAQQFNESRALL